jgi:hemerythrin
MDSKRKAAWEDELRLGVEDVDREHGLQVRLVEALQEALVAGADRATTAEILQRLDDCSDVHFMGEELLMRLHSYPRYHLHVEEHRRLLGTLRELRARFEGGQAPTLDTVEELRRWLAGHVRGLDRDVAEWVSGGEAAQ